MEIENKLKTVEVRLRRIGLIKIRKAIKMT